MLEIALIANIMQRRIVLNTEINEKLKIEYDKFPADNISDDLNNVQSEVINRKFIKEFSIK